MPNELLSGINPILLLSGIDTDNNSNQFQYSYSDFSSLWFYQVVDGKVQLEHFDPEIKVGSMYRFSRCKKMLVKITKNSDVGYFMLTKIPRKEIKELSKEPSEVQIEKMTNKPIDISFEPVFGSFRSFEEIVSSFNCCGLVEFDKVTIMKIVEIEDKQSFERIGVC